MPWREPYITTRRHPMALAGYGITALLGLAFMLHQFHSNSIDDTFSRVPRILWEVSMLWGGVGALGFAVLVRKDVLFGLIGEMWSALLAGSGQLLYASAILATSGWRSAPWLMMAVLMVGCLCRARQIRKKDMPKLRDLELLGGLARQHGLDLP